MSRVVVVRFSGASNNGRLDEEAYHAMLAAGMKSLAGKRDTQEAVRSFLPDGVIGMKTNCIARKLNSTPVALVGALSQILVDSGVDDNNILVWERTNRELKQAGYELNASSFGRRCFGTDTEQAGYGRTFYTSGDVSSLVSRILTDMVRYNINVSVLKDHSMAGLSAGMKNMYGAINNPNKYHDNGCDPYVAHVNALDPIKDKNRLSVIDAVRVQYNGGPGYIGSYVDYYGGVILSDDPVAADSIALDILEHLRQKNSQPPLAAVKREVKYLRSAQEIGLGVTDRSGIDVKVLTVDRNGSYRTGELL